MLVSLRPRFGNLDNRMRVLHGCDFLGCGQRSAAYRAAVLSAYRQLVDFHFAVHAHHEGHPYPYVALGAEELPCHGSAHARIEPH